MASDTVTVVSAYQERGRVEEAIKALRNEGFKERDIKILKSTGEALVGELRESGFDEQDARDFADEAREGRTLVSAQVPSDRADRAISIMERIERSKASDNGSGEEETVPVIEEEVAIEKHKIGQGGVRVRSKPTEQPIEEKVTLREENVDVERRPADRPLEGREADEAFTDKTVEMMGSREEAEVRKEARVTGEVALTRETSAREAKIRDTLRSTEVEVEEIKGQSPKKK